MKRPIIMDTEELTVIDENPRRKRRKTGETDYSIMLTVIQGSDADFGKIFHLSQDSIHMGRDKSNTILVDDPKVSKQHCEIHTIKTDGLEQIVIRDLDSTNGTYVNHHQIQQQILKTGDKISLGETVYRFSYNDDIEEEYHSKLFNFAATDSLTGLYNRRYVLNELENHHKIAKRNNRIFSIIVLDIDDFKKINDTFGHSAGDECLKNISFIITNTLREQDISGRIGGEEFLLILPETNIGGAEILADRIRQEIEESQVIYHGSTIKNTISAGVCQYYPDSPPISSEVLFQEADKAMYQAKRTGKNRVIIIEMNQTSP